MGQISAFLGNPRQVARINSFLVYTILIVGSLVASHFIVSRTGMKLFMMAIIGIFFGTVYTVISFGNLFTPFLVWIASVFGFRFLASIRAPGLPDLYLDRMTMLWLIVVYFVKYFAEKRKFRGPHLLDVLMLVNALYILILIYVVDMRSFHDWTMSYMIPYAAYFFAKNLVITNQQIRQLLLVLLILLVYYSITSISEKFRVEVLIWPKYIIKNIVWYGRSNGPFRHAPLFGTVIGMMIPIHLYFIATVRNQLVKLLLYTSMMMGFAGLYFTYTRGSWLVGIMALMTVVILNRKHYLKLVLPAVIVAPVVAVLFLGIGQDKFMKKRVENEDTLANRLGTLVTATKVWRANPFFGVGINQYRTIVDDYVEPLELPLIGVIEVRKFRNNPPHDIYLAFLAEAGIVGVMLQGAIYFMIFRTFLLKYRERKKGDYFAQYFLPVFAGIFVGYLVGGLAINYVYFSAVGTLFYSCAGIMYGYRPEDAEASVVVKQRFSGDNNLGTPRLRIQEQPTSQVD